MTELIGLLTDPWSLDFMRRAFLVAAMAGIVCGVIGTFVVLRGMSFMGDAIAHAVFPGVAIGFVLQANLVVSGAIAGIVTALGVSFVAQNRRLREDAVIGVFWAFTFALGVVVVSTQPNFTGDLASFLFGQILGINDADVLVVAVVGVVLLVAITLVRKEIVTVSLDRETARASGLPVNAIDALLYVMVAVAAVISLQAVGNVLVIALLITPASTMRLLTDRLSLMLVGAALLGAGCSLLGLYVSYHFDLASGGLIVLILSAVFAATWLLAPSHGLIPRRLAQRRAMTADPRSASPSA